MQFLRSKNESKLGIAPSQIVAIDDIEISENAAIALKVTFIKNGIASFMVYRSIEELLKEWELIDGIGGEVCYGEISGVD